MTILVHTVKARPFYRSLGILLAIGVLVGSCTPSTYSSTPEADSTTANEPELSSPSSPSETPSELITDTTIVPGDRVGDITAATTDDDLAAIYGEDVLENTEVNMGEGTVAPGTRVNQGDRSFSVVWTDESRSSVQSVRDFGTAWQVDPGIGIGTSFEDLQTQLGEFDLYGFGWDYGGTMVLDGTVLEPYKEVLILRVSPSVANAGEVEGYSTVMGDQLYPSSTPVLQDLDLVVSDMIVVLN